MVLSWCKLPQDGEKDVGMLTWLGTPLDSLDIHPEDLIPNRSKGSLPPAIFEHPADSDDTIESPNSKAGIEPVLVPPIISESVVEVIPCSSENEYGQYDMDDEEDLV